MSRNTMGKKLGQRVSISVLMLLSMPVMASASTISDATAPSMEIITRYPMLSDWSLSKIRGKYVDGANVVYFGLQLVTRWQDAQDNWMKINSNIGINLKQPNDPFYIKNWSTTGGQLQTGSNSFSDHTVQGQEPSQSNGVLQSIQIAGDGNQVGNQAQVQVGPVGSFPLKSGPETGLISPHLVVCQGGETIGSVDVGTSGVSLSINLPGMGNVSQGLGTGGISQTAQVFSNANQVFNQLTMQVGTSGGNPLAGLQTSLILQRLGDMVK